MTPSVSILSTCVSVLFEVLFDVKVLLGVRIVKRVDALFIKRYYVVFTNDYTIAHVALFEYMYGFVLKGLKQHCTNPGCLKQLTKMI